MYVSVIGLRKMSSDNAEVSSILNILAKKIDLSDSVLNAQAISNALVRSGSCSTVVLVVAVVVASSGSSSSSQVVVRK